MRLMDYLYSHMFYVRAMQVLSAGEGVTWILPGTKMDCRVSTHQIFLQTKFGRGNVARRLTRISKSTVVMPSGQRKHIKPGEKRAR